MSVAAKVCKPLQNSARALATQALQQRVQQLEASKDKHSLHDRLDGLHDRLDGLFDRLDGRLDRILDRLDGFHDKFVAILHTQEVIMDHLKCKDKGLFLK